MNDLNVYTLVKEARAMSKDESSRAARKRYRDGGPSLRRKARLYQRRRRRAGGEGLKTRVRIQTTILSHRPVRIRKEPLRKIQRGM